MFKRFMRNMREQRNKVEISVEDLRELEYIAMRWYNYRETEYLNEADKQKIKGEHDKKEMCLEIAKQMKELKEIHETKWKEL